MTDHRPSFQVSPERRPMVQRLTPLAWALIGVVVLVALLVVVGGVAALAGRSSGQPWNPTPTAPPPPSATPVLPTATPTAWWAGSMTATPEPTPAFPAWWSAQMTQDEDGLWWPPEEVVEMVREDFDGFGEFNRQVFFSGPVRNYLPSRE